MILITRRFTPTDRGCVRSKISSKCSLWSQRWPRNNEQKSMLWIEALFGMEAANDYVGEHTSRQSECSMQHAAYHDNTMLHSFSNGATVSEANFQKLWEINNKHSCVSKTKVIIVWAQTERRASSKCHTAFRDALTAYGSGLERMCDLP